MPVNRAKFARTVLRQLGIRPTDGAVKALIGWERAEGGHWANDAHHNPLNTTQPMRGAGNTGTQGNIKQYRTWRQGVRATVKTLENGNYGGILKALRAGDPQGVASAIDSSPWGTHGSLIYGAIAAAPGHKGSGPTLDDMVGNARGGSQHPGNPVKGAPALKTGTADVSALLASLEHPAPVTSGVPQGPSFSARQAPITTSSPAQDSGSSLDALLAGASSLKGTTLPASETPKAGKGGRQTGPAGRVNADGGVPQWRARGKVNLAPGANRAGVSTKPVLMNFVQKVSALLGEPITITTGTNHSQLTTSGSVSDHWDGHGADIGVPIDSAQGNRIAARALMLAGVPKKKARQMAQQGGLYNVTYRGHKVQVIWKTYEGGNHHDHVHIGIR